MKDKITEEDHHSTLLVRDAMESAVAELPSLHGLVSAAVTQGRRRKARARLAIAAGSACAAAAVVVASLTLSGGDGARSTVRPAATLPNESPGPVQPKPYRTPVHLDSAAREEQHLEGLTPVERTRQAEFQQKAAVLLDQLLPDTVGLIRPVYLDATDYQGETEGGKVFYVALSVRPYDGGPGPRPCSGTFTKGGSCENVTLPGAIKATSLRMFVRSPDVMSTEVGFVYANSKVVFTVYPGVGSGSSPITGKELLAIAGDSRFLGLVHDATQLPSRRHTTS
ncbi:hypothetical protein ACFVU0_36920 [Streptomyces sp. NPDC058122]|uniref:hypothetical protein n=1 Tax=Streptomyces sp. NPDC058122 TaxID=3346349 RepID=UPI0036E836C2